MLILRDILLIGRLIAHRHKTSKLVWKWWTIAQMCVYMYCCFHALVSALALASALLPSFWGFFCLVLNYFMCLDQPHMIVSGV